MLYVGKFIDILKKKLDTYCIYFNSFNITHQLIE